MEPPFTLFCFPRKKLPLEGTVNEFGLSSGVVHIEVDAGVYDPLVMHGDDDNGLFQENLLHDNREHNFDFELVLREGLLY